MNHPRQKHSAIKVSVSLALLLIASAASAESIGTVTELDGTLLVSRANGSVKVLGVDSAIEQGDVLSSRKQTYVTVTLADSSTVTLGPDTDLKVEQYVFHKHVPDGDGALFALAHGSVRITAGVLGTRGETVTLAAPDATMDIHGASLIAEYVMPDAAKVALRDTRPRDSRMSNMMVVSYNPAADAGFVRSVSDSGALRLAQIPSSSGPRPPVPTGGPALLPGLYVQVIDGAINLSNKGGSQSFTAGQFGYTANVTKPPIVVPANPGIKFTPPPTFASTPGSQGVNGGTKPAAVDCQVR